MLPTEARRGRASMRPEKVLRKAWPGRDVWMKCDERASTVQVSRDGDDDDTVCVGSARNKEDAEEPIRHWKERIVAWV